MVKRWFNSIFSLFFMVLGCLLITACILAFQPELYRPFSNLQHTKNTFVPEWQRKQLSHSWSFVEALHQKLYGSLYWTPRCDFSQPRWDEWLDHDLIERRLKTERIACVVPLDTFFGKPMWSSHYLRMVILESGLIGFFKSRHKKNIPHFRLRHYGSGFHHGEVAAYRLNRLLGLRLVPPTVFRRVDGIPGSLQFYIDGVVYDTRKLLSYVDKEIIASANLFCYVAGQWDNYWGIKEKKYGKNKVIIVSRGLFHLGLIDNAGMYLKTHSRYGGSIYIEQGHENYVAQSHLDETFPFLKEQEFHGNDERFSMLVSPYLYKEHVQQLRKRINHKVIRWNHALWVYHRMATDVDEYQFSRLFLEALVKLRKEDLEKVWRELLLLQPDRARDLIKGILDRRDEIVCQALISGRIT